MRKETWTEIRFAPEYHISSFGRIWSTISKKFLIGAALSGRGYPRVNLKGRVYQVHRIVAESFLSPIVGKHQVNHKNGNKLDNSVTNLEWVTNAENHAHAQNLGLIKKGSQLPQAKLQEIDVKVIRAVYAQTRCLQKDLAIWFGTTQKNISKIIRFTRWKHI